MPDQQHLDAVQECATVTDVPHYIDVCKLNVVVEDLNRSLEVRSSATTQLASIVKMNDYYPTSISPVAAEQRSILSISMDSIECKSKDTADRHSPTGIRFEQPPTVQERGQVSAALHQSSPPSASTSSISTGLSKLPRLFRSLLKKCSPTTTGSYRLVHNDHCVMATAEPILLQLSYVDGRRGLVDDNARKSLMQKSILANVKLDVHNNSSGLPKSRPEKVSYRKRVFQPFEAIWKGVDKSTVLGVTH